MTASVAGSLYTTRLMHARRVAPFYRFVYRGFYLLLDIDRIDKLAGRLRWFSRNRFNLLSFRDADYGSGEHGGLRAWAESLLKAGGVDCKGGRIRLLTLPRLLGFAFNPISLWYCEKSDGQLAAVIAEVRNTFGEKHAYLLADPLRGAASVVEGRAYDWVQEKEKCFHVSPFFDLVGRYRFGLDQPAENLSVMIHETRNGEPILDAALAGQRRDLSDREILAQVLRMPWMTLGVVVGIHWQALKIWLRGARFHPKPALPSNEVT